MPFLANNPLNLVKSVQASMLPVSKFASAPIGLDPLFGRPKWTYVNLQKSPVTGPTAHLARGTGHTGDSSLPGNSAALPGYLSDTEYFPITYEYAPVHNEDYTKDIPLTIKTGNNGRELVSTYDPHDVTIATRFFHQNRSAYDWQVTSFPPDTRNLLQFQQVQKYNLQNAVKMARPLPTNNYFLGYQMDPSIQASIGNSGYGAL